MRMVILAGLFAIAAVPVPAHAIGCASGAVVGGVGGHYAGRHGLLGAVAGCAIGHHEAVKQRRERDEARNAEQQQREQADLERARQPRPY